MASKLTLSIDEGVIKRAKSFALHSNRSLSEIIESYLDKITTSTNSMIDNELETIKGVITLTDNFDEKLEIRKILTKKHL